MVVLKIDSSVPYIKRTILETDFSHQKPFSGDWSEQPVSLHFTSLSTAGWSHERCRHAHLRKVSPSSCEHKSLLRSTCSVPAETYVFLGAVNPPLWSSFCHQRPRCHQVLVLSGRQLGSLGHPGGSGYVGLFNSGSQCLYDQYARVAWPLLNSFTTDH